MSEELRRLGDVDRELADLLDIVYESALVPNRWEDALARIAPWLGAPRALLFTPDASLDAEGFFYAYGISVEEMAIWNSRYVGQDFWTARILERNLHREGAVIRCQDVSTRRELLESDYYREHLVRMDIGRLMSGVILAPPDRSLPVVALSCYLGVDAPAGFSDVARDRLALLMPHLSRAMGLMFRLRAAELRSAASASALDGLSFGVALLNGQGRAVFANAVARRIWHAQDGLRMDARGHMQFDDDRSARAWAAALGATLGGGGRAAHYSEVIAAPRGTPGQGYLVQLSQLPEQGLRSRMPSEAKAIVFITDAARNALPSPITLMRLYGLSPAEARTACALGGGAKLAEVAQTLGLSVNTIKTQVKHVYAKLGCKSRAELTRLLLSLGAVAEENARQAGIRPPA